MKIQIELTPEQVEKLKPLFDAVKKNHMKGAIVGQVWEPAFCEGLGMNTTAVFDFCTPDEIRAITDEAEKEIKQWEERYAS
jgi:hypothetical protein